MPHIRLATRDILMLPAPPPSMMLPRRRPLGRKYVVVLLHHLARRRSDRPRNGNSNPALACPSNISHAGQASLQCTRGRGVRPPPKLCARGGPLRKGHTSLTALVPFAARGTTRTSPSMSLPGCFTPHASPGRTAIRYRWARLGEARGFGCVIAMVATGAHEVRARPAEER
jgi:hypothetical protein